MNKKKKVDGKEKYHLITDVKSDCRETFIISFDTIDHLKDFIVDELENKCAYSFEDGNDVIIHGDIMKVDIVEKTYKVNIK